MNRKDLPERWAKLLDLSVNESKYKSLIVTDFQYDVKIIFEDGSKVNFKSVLIWENKEEYIIFTEHCGYHIFDKLAIKKINTSNYTWTSKKQI